MNTLNISLLIILIIFTSCNAKKEVKVETISFNGIENTIELSNDDIRLIVAPSIGRIVYYGLVGKENLTYLTDDIATIEQKSPIEYFTTGVKSPHYGGDRVLTTITWEIQKIKPYNIENSKTVGMPIV